MARQGRAWPAARSPIRHPWRATDMDLPKICRILSSTTMIVIKVSNSSDVVASRIGRFLADLTPSGFDQNKVEDELMKQLVEQMAAQGLQGEVAAVKGIDLHKETLRFEEKVKIRRRVVI
jgi:hypothetical protein